MIQLSYFYNRCSTKIFCCWITQRNLKNFITFLILYRFSSSSDSFDKNHWNSLLAISNGYSFTVIYSAVYYDVSFLSLCVFELGSSLLQHQIFSKTVELLLWLQCTARIYFPLSSSACIRLSEYMCTSLLWPTNLSLFWNVGVADFMSNNCLIWRTAYLDRIEGDCTEKRPHTFAYTILMKEHYFRKYITNHITI